MFVELLDERVRLVRPRSFAGLMTLYESNYVRLRQLLGKQHAFPDRAVSVTGGDLDLYLRVLERSPYTTTLQLTYWFEEEGIRIPDPDLVVRIYHDARLGEALSCTPHHRHQTLRRYQMHWQSELDRRWAMNVLLNKWLEFCLEKGHSLAGPTARRFVRM